jgi:capsular exopolysaccharide synthesis family protein
VRKDKLYMKKHKRPPRKSTGSTNYSKAGSLSSNRFSVVEAYKTLRTNLQFSMTGKGCNVIIVTSTMPLDGKSTVTANTAVAFSQIDKKVLVIDCDMRKPQMNKFFNVPAVPGLSNVLAGLCKAPEGIHPTEYKNLDIIPSGILPPNPAELLMSTAMEELVEELRLVYDLIILDTPPVNVVSDAVAVTKIADGVVLVIRHSVTSHPDVEKSIKSLEFVNAKILGIVFNAVDYSKIYGKRYGAYYKGVIARFNCQ